ncbi:hypothetical protein [Stenotrophomonas sp.]|uniref:hypothetical protein n=1 Tax=Stenotrophomonas sp. TaxID=69392 RepID=UPI0028AD662B|nr:hypothetical protein [Stenotrophomonas sp.]
MSSLMCRFAALIALVLTSGCHAAETPADGYRFAGSVPAGKTVRVCKGSRCSDMPSPEKLQFQLEEEYQASFVDLDGDGRKELVMTGPAGVNRCITIYKPSPVDGHVSIYQPGGAAICNYQLRAAYLYSQSRDGATVVEEQYLARNGSLVLQARDSCVGCGQVARERFSAGKVAQRGLVTDAPRMEDRRPIGNTVVVDKASLFNSADALDPSRMYLVKGDAVEVLERSGEGRSAMFRIRYARPGRPAIEKWLQCSSLGNCR